MKIKINETKKLINSVLYFNKIEFVRLKLFIKKVLKKVPNTNDIEINMGPVVNTSQNISSLFAKGLFSLIDHTLLIAASSVRYNDVITRNNVIIPNIDKASVLETNSLKYF